MLPGPDPENFEEEVERGNPEDHGLNLLRCNSGELPATTSPEFE